VCSNDITPHFLAAINADFPAVLQYEVPAYIADSKYYTNGKKFLDIPAHSTVYSIWIGTNDLGDNAFLTDSQVAGTTIPDYIACVYEALDQVYGNGARYFVLMNIAPLQLTPLYATPEAGGVAATQFWPNKPSNLTEISYRMWEQVVTVNDVYRHQTPFDVLVRNRYPGAKFAVMDMYGLVSSPLFYSPSTWSTEKEKKKPDLGYLLPSRAIPGRTGQCHWVHQPVQRGRHRLRARAQPQFLPVVRHPASVATDRRDHRAEFRQGRQGDESVGHLLGMTYT
jgi:hypothetical protein